MHSANLEKSHRLTRLLNVLIEAKQHQKVMSTMELVDKTRICAVSTAISELRAQGYVIDCFRVDRVFYYILVAHPRTRGGVFYGKRN